MIYRTGTTAPTLAALIPPRVVQPKPQGAKSNAWMITFADLVALMLTFFVLLFAMSQITQQKWQSIVESLTSRLSATQRIEPAKYARDYQVAVDVAAPGADLDYLVPVLREHFASEPLLADAKIEHVVGGLSISVPGTPIFVGRAADLTAQGSKIVFALGRVLQNLHNAVDVNTRVLPESTSGAPDWNVALARSIAVTRVLAQSGFTGPIVSRGQTGESASPRSDGLDILIRADRRG